MPAEAIGETLEALELEVVSFDTRQAYQTGLLRNPTRFLGLSLADRACLALAIRLGYGVLTADRQWANLDLGLEIRLIR